MGMRVNEVAEKIKISLGNIASLKSILISNATEHKQILSELSELGANSLPAAIITAGTGRDMSGMNRLREQQFGLVLIDRFRARRTEKDAGIWDVFAVVDEAIAAPIATIADGIDIKKGDFYPLELDQSQFAAVVLEITARYK